MKGHTSGQNDLQVIEPDTLTLGELVRYDLNTQTGSPEYREWLEKRGRR